MFEGTFSLLGMLLYYFIYIFINHWPQNVADQLSDGDSYDFIVVGSGSAGSPVAARLAQRGHNVLLLEAGGKPPLSTVIPGICAVNMFSDIDWKFTSEYDERACQSLENGHCYKSRGKVLGGSSATNFMVYVRGNKVDYDDWHVPNWTYDKMLPYFRRMESVTDYDDLPLELQQHHNNTGPLKISQLSASIDPWRDRLINAYQEIGLERNMNVNGPSQTGITITPTTIYNGERQSTAEAYLVPNSKNKHLNVAYDSYVTKVIINKSNIVKGVRVNVDGKKEITIRAKKEIILSTGTIKTPQLLMLSGIGPKSELKRHGIQVHVNNPYVGQRLQDHPMTPLILTANTGIATSIDERVLVRDSFEQWFYDRSGLFATNLNTDISAFVDTVDAGSIPDVQFMHSFLNRSDSNFLNSVVMKMFMFNNEIANEIQELKKDSEILIAMPILLRPVSRGSIHLASKNPYDHPIIHGKTLFEPKDYETYLRAIRLFEKLLETKTFLKNTVKLVRIKSLKKCNAHKFRSDDYWLCYRDNLGDTIYHPVGTASIGRVVDEKLRVYGVKRLRVADASIMCLIPRGNTNAPTIAIGERAADFISEDHHL